MLCSLFVTDATCMHYLPGHHHSYMTCYMYLHLNVLAIYVYTCHDFFLQLINNALYYSKHSKYKSALLSELFARGLILVHISG